MIVLSEKLQRSRWKSWFRLQQSQSGMPELKFVPQFWIGSHTLTSLRTCNIQDLWRVLTLISLLNWWGSNSCMLISFQFFAFQFASGPSSQIWSFFSLNILFIWACCICASPILSKAPPLWPHLLPLLNPACQASSSNTLGSRGQIWIEWMYLSERRQDVGQSVTKLPCIRYLFYV